MCVSSNQELGRRKLSARVASVDRTLILTASSNSARPNPSQYPQSGSAAKMAFPHSALDATCFVHDITTQATAGTRHNDTFTNNLEYESRYWEGGCNGNNQGTWPLKDMTAGHHRGYWEVLATPQQTEARDIADARHFGSAYTYDEEDQSTCPTFMSTTSSLASLSSSSSSDELPSRPPSELGWNYEGDRDMGTFGKAPSNSQSWGQPEAVCVDEQDFVETGSGNPTLIAQFVAQQLRMDLEDDFYPWKAAVQSPEQQETPRMDNARVSQYRPPLGRLDLPNESEISRYGDLINALGLSNGPQFPIDSSPHDTIYTPSSIATELPTPSSSVAELPTIMVTAPSSEPTSPLFLTYDGDEETISFLTTYHTSYPDRRPTFSLPSDEEDSSSEYDDEEDNIALSEVKKSLELSQRTAKVERAFTGKVMRLFSRDRH